MEENKITKAISDSIQEINHAFSIIAEIAETRFGEGPIYKGGKKSGEQISKAIDSIVDSIFCVFK